jgi:hypothetical protein
MTRAHPHPNTPNLIFFFTFFSNFIRLPISQPLTSRRCAARALVDS